MNTYLKIPKYYRYLGFDVHILGLVKFEQYKQIISKNIKGKYFKLPKTNTFDPEGKKAFCLQIFTPTISNHTIYIRKRYVENCNIDFSVDLFCFHSELINKTKSIDDYFFRTFLFYQSEQEAIHALNIFIDHFNDKYKIILKDSFKLY